MSAGRRALGIGLVLAWTTALWLVLAAAPAQAAGASFQTVEFNLCSRHCTEDPDAPGSSDTNYGINPIAEPSGSLAPTSRSVG